MDRVQSTVRVFYAGELEMSITVELAGVMFRVPPINSAARLTCEVVLPVAML